MKYNNSHRVSEALIQAEFYHQCELLNIKCVLGYTHWHIGGNRSILDAIVVNKSDDIVLIVEFKSYIRVDQKPFYATKQIKKYESLGVPVLIISRLRDIRPLVDKISQLLEDGVVSGEYHALRWYRQIEWTGRGSKESCIKKSLEVRSKRHKTVVMKQY